MSNARQPVWMEIKFILKELAAHRFSISDAFKAICECFLIVTEEEKEEIRAILSNRIETLLDHYANKVEQDPQRCSKKEV